MLEEIRKYNLVDIGFQNYYRIATNVNLDVSKLNRAIMTVFTNSLKEISKKSRKLTPQNKRDIINQ